MVLGLLPEHLKDEEFDVELFEFVPLCSVDRLLGFQKLVEFSLVVKFDQMLGTQEAGVNIVVELFLVEVNVLLASGLLVQTGLCSLPLSLIIGFGLNLRNLQSV